MKISPIVNAVKLKGIIDPEFLKACENNRMTVAVGETTGKRVAKVYTSASSWVTYIFNKEGQRLQRIEKNSYHGADNYLISRTEEGINALESAGVSRYRYKFQQINIFRNCKDAIFRKKLAFSNGADISGHPTASVSTEKKELTVDIGVLGKRYILNHRKYPHESIVTS